jgi:ABC-type multidrug transport system ATPase subunit
MEKICTHLAVMHEGRLRFSGRWDPAEANRRIVVKVDRQAEANAGLAAAGLLAWSEEGLSARLQPGATISSVANWLVQRGFAVERIAAEPMSLEDFYLETILPGAPASTR